MVDGDGVEVTSADDSDISWSRDPSTEREEEDASQSSHEEYTSWGQKGGELPWPSPPPTDDEDLAFSTRSSSTPQTSVTDAGWQSPLRLFTSTISSIVETTSNSLGASKGHRRTPSLQHRPTHERRPSYHRSPPVSMESVQQPAPRPLLRRSTHSHPDISSLCKDWANSGPANQTVNYKAVHQSQKSRRNSQAKSVVDLFAPLT